MSLLIALYDTIRYDSMYLTCSKKLTGSQLSPPHVHEEFAQNTLGLVICWTMDASGSSVPEFELIDH